MKKIILTFLIIITSSNITNSLFNSKWYSNENALMNKRSNKFSIGKNFESYEKKKSLLKDDFAELTPIIDRDQIFNEIDRNNLTNFEFESNKRIKNKIKAGIDIVDSMSNNNTFIRKIFNDIIEKGDFNFSTLNKGRSEDETKQVLKLMIMAIQKRRLQSKLTNTDDNNTSKTQTINDKINELIKPILNTFSSGLFEKDIVLSKEQAFQILLNPNMTQKVERKILRNNLFRWPTPIFYVFDGTHSKKKKKIDFSSINY
jgi:hypothetical protein